MKYLLQLATAIAQRKKDEELQKLTHDLQSEIEKEITTLSNNDMDKILNALFPKGVPTGSSFYSSLADIEHYTGFKPLSQKLIEYLWISAYDRLSPSKKIDILKSLVDEKQRGFWRAIHTLPEFCSQVGIEPQFAAGWFFELADRAKGDLAGGDVFKAVSKYAFHFPEFGLRAFEKYVSEGLDELRVNLAAILLGTVRSRASQGYIAKKSIQKWDDQLQDNSKTAFRLCYHKSLVASFDLGTLSLKELDVKLTKMLDGVQEEIDEAFNTVYRCLLEKLSDYDFVRFAMNWFSKNVSSQIPALAKYCVVDAMWRLCGIQREEPRLVTVSEANNLLIAIQPIPSDNSGTWHQLEDYLVDRLHEAPAVFEDIFTRLIESNSEGLLAQFEERKFEYLESEMSKSNIEELVTKWIFSPNHRKRITGRLLFQKIKLDFISKEVLFKADEIQLKMALLEFIRQPFLGEKTSQYLLMLEPRFREASSELQDMFKNEMIIQAINYPEACLANWKKISTPSKSLQDVITSAEQYFSNLRTIKDSPAINFSFPGYKDAAEKGYREFSYQVAQGARKQSIFAQLTKKVEIIYGSRWSIMVEGKLGKDTPFGEISSSMEFPRLEEIDPEGMALRKIGASVKIKDLENSYGSKKSMDK